MKTRLNDITMKRIALISFFHCEATLCLAKYLARQGCKVDCFLIVDYLRDKGSVPGFDYHRAAKSIGISHLKEKDIPEIYRWAEKNPVDFFLLRLLSYSPKLWWLNKIIIKRAISVVKRKNYDAINIIGQHNWLRYFHKQLLGTNLIHSLHEVGSHQNGSPSSPYIDMLIRDKSKILLFSSFLEQRLRAIDGAEKCAIDYIPFGKFETIKLYCNKKTGTVINLPKGKVIFLFYGMIKPYKGLSLLLKAVDKLQFLTDNFHLIIAGGGNDDNLIYFQKMKNVTIINRFLLDEEMAYLNDISDVVLLPYKSASQSGIIPTSFLFGNPVIATKVGALKENIIDGHNGILVEPDDVNGFSEAMLQVIESAGLLMSLKNGVSQYGENDDYDWNIIAKRTLDFYLNR